MGTLRNRLLRLLLVEDNPADATLVEVGLENARARFKLDIAVDGAQAIERLLLLDQTGASAYPDLILLDLNLPRMTGHDVLQTIKAHPGLRRIPVVILTSSRNASDIRAAYMNGASSYLQKPDSIEDTFDLMGTLHHYWADYTLFPADA